MLQKIIICLILILSVSISSCKKEDDDSISNGIYIPADTTANTDTVLLSRLEFQVSTFRNTNGMMVAALFNSASGYSSNSIYRSSIISLTSTTAFVTFDSIPSGEYSFSCFHDEDGNGSLNTNAFGIPNEGYGFSNNPGITFGLPSFSTIKFTVTEGDTVNKTVNLIYL